MTIATMGSEAKLLVKLQKYTRRDLIKRPPLATDTMQHIGVSSTNLDLPIRRWINSDIRVPAGLRALVRNEIKSSTTWPNLVKMLSGAHP